MKTHMAGAYPLFIGYLSYGLDKIWMKNKKSTKTICLYFERRDIIKLKHKLFETLI